MDDGASVGEIARGLGVAHTTVTRSLVRRDEALASPSRTRPRRPNDQGKREKRDGLSSLAETVSLG
ncbi:hypothetical protein [Saxibacter everestensis]|uniref:hypothetical protein n=1 Tax=Saxibacter everestensis TaxID=2909229 RepID=UPI003D80A555